MAIYQLPKLFHPSFPNDRQPLHQVKINPQHSLSRGLVACWVFNDAGSVNITDLVSKQNATHTDPATVTHGADAEGQFHKTDDTGDTDAWTMGSVPTLDNFGSEATVVIGQKARAMPAGGSGGRYFCKSDGATGDRLGAIITSGARGLRLRAAGNQITSPTNVIGEGTYHNLCFRYKSGLTNGMNINVDGVEVESSTQSGSFTNDGQDIGIGRHPDAVDRALQADLYFIYVFNRYLSDAEMQALTGVAARPYQFLISANSPIYSVPSVVGPPTITANQTEAGDTQSADLDVLVSITANQTEAGDTQSATVQAPAIITANQSEAGDTQAAAIQHIASITANQVEAGDTTAAAIVGLIAITASQAEDGDATVAALKSIVQVSAAQTEAGDATVASIVGIVTSEITAAQTEAGDTTAANLAAIVQVSAAQTEAGDSTVAALIGVLTSSVTASQTEAGDVTSATLSNIVSISASQAEAGDTQAAAIQALVSVAANQTEAGDGQAAAISTAISSDITANQTEAGDTQTAALNNVVSINASQAEAGDSQVAVIENIVIISAAQAEAGDTQSASIVHQQFANISANQDEAGDATVAAIVTQDVVRNVAITLKSPINDTITLKSPINDIITVESKLA